MKIIVATNNEHKLREIEAIIGSNFELVKLADVGFFGEIPEDQSTLEGNAQQKAALIYNRYQLPTIADDTGLFVPALGGAPGVFSARYAKMNHSDLTNVDFLLTSMTGVEVRSAYFRTIFAMVDSTGTQYFEGVCHGHILDTIRGVGGFGYDPVFVPQGYNMTFAEMDAEVKNMISHRAKALERLRGYFVSSS